ncbi:hypothetical protein EV426DRAFT_579051 [Tirmania nivea]|nr:hypothetical protein EV426DRAFT_579051 [Tirmania nivea]
MGGKGFKTLTSKLTNWIYANEHTVDASAKSFLLRASNLSIDGGLIDVSLDLNGEMVDQDFSRTRDRLDIWGIGLVPTFCVDMLIGGVKQCNEEAGEALASDSEDDDLLRQVGICFVNLRMQAYWLKMLIRGKQAITGLTSGMKLYKVWVIDHGMSLWDRYILYTDWRKNVREGEGSSVLVVTYQATWQAWDFSKASTYIFIQQPWLKQYKAHTLGQFFNYDQRRMNMLRVFDINEGELMNRVVKETGSRGAKITLCQI